MSHKNRLAKLEKQQAEQPQIKPPSIIEIRGTRPDGSTYVIETWEQLISADGITPLHKWEKFIAKTTDEQIEQQEAQP